MRSNTKDYDGANLARVKLRQLTFKAHEAMHHQRDFAAILSGRLTMTDYARLINCLSSFHETFEEMLRQSSVHLVPEINFTRREMAHLLEADLSALDMNLPRYNPSQLQRHMPDVQSREGVLGSLYVVEGAALGGKIVAEKLRYLFKNDDRAGRQFFRGRPQPDALPWSTFCEVLQLHAVTADFDKVKEAALQTFGALFFWLNHDGDQFEGHYHGP